MDTPLPEVYDLAADFGESENLAEKTDLASLRKELAQITRNWSSPASGRGGRVADSRTRERLRSLGYAAAPVAQPKASYGPADDLKSIIPDDELAARMSELPKDKRVVTHCLTGIRAEMAYHKLKEKGYNVAFVKGDIAIDKSGKLTITPN